MPGLANFCIDPYVASCFSACVNLHTIILLEIDCTLATSAGEIC